MSGSFHQPQSAEHHMDVDVRPCASPEEVKHAIAPIAYYFGRSAPDENLAERLTGVLPAQRVYAAWWTIRSFC